MELYQLRTFLTVGETGNLGKAALLLNTSQPAISAQIKALESELGFPLFTRTPRGMQITDQGSVAFDLARKIITETENLKAYSRMQGKENLRIFHIAICTEPSILRIDQLAEYVTSVRHGTHIEFAQLSTAEIIGQIKDSKLDGGFVFGCPDEKGIKREFLSRIELLIACPKAWERELRDADMRTILRKPWILPAKDCAFHDLVNGIFRKHGILPHNTLISQHETTTKQLIRSGLGISLLPKHMCADTEDLFVVKKENAEVDLSYAYPEKTKDSDDTRMILHAIKKIWE